MGLTEGAGAHSPVCRRAMCSRCQRPQTACVCGWVRPLAPATKVLILQHPDEAGHAKNTARLLHLSLAHSTLLVGTVFDDEVLRAHGVGTGLAALLYPDTTPSGPDAAAGAQDCAVPVQSDGVERCRVPPPPSCLVVLDGTWRQSRQMLRAHPLLQRLPRLALVPSSAGAYRIRKAHRVDQLSTLEAVCLALQQLEGPTLAIEPLLQAFEGFVAEQVARGSHRKFRQVAADPAACGQ